MEFSNPFDNPQGQFAILQNDRGSTACGRSSASCPRAGAWSANRNLRRRASSGWRNSGRRLSRFILRGARMNRLPLVAAQPGIWMAEQLSSLPNARSVAHYTELKGAIDAPLLAKAIAEGMMQADTCGCVLPKITVRCGSGSMRPCSCRSRPSCALTPTTPPWR